MLSKQDDDLIVYKKYISSFDKIYVIIVCCEDIYGRYSIQRSNDAHFYP